MLMSCIAARLCGRTARPSVARSLRPSRCYHDFAQSKFFRVSEQVRDAVATGQPVVALESTIYTHGTLLLGGGRVALTKTKTRISVP